MADDPKDRSRKTWTIMDKQTAIRSAEKRARFEARGRTPGAEKFVPVRKKFWNDCPVCGLPWLHRFKSDQPCPDCRG